MNKKSKAQRTPSVSFADSVSLRLGHAHVLTTHRVIIHCARAASLPKGRAFWNVGGSQRALPLYADLNALCACLHAENDHVYFAF